VLVAADPVPVLVGPQECLLGDVLGAGAVARQRIGQLDHPPAFAGIEIIEAARQLQHLILRTVYRWNLVSGHSVPPDPSGRGSTILNLERTGEAPRFRPGGNT
jgi:hypothetical protein